jgi:hypothetical protein
MAAPDSKIDMTVVRYNLARFRKDRRDSTPENVFRISTILPNGMSYAEFALFYVLKNKKTGSTASKRVAKSKIKIFGDSSDSVSPPLPPTRASKSGRSLSRKDETNLAKIDEEMLSKRFRDVIGDPALEDIGSFTVSKRRKKVKEIIFLGQK